MTLPLSSPAERRIKRARIHDLIADHGAGSLVLESAGALSWYLDGARTTVSAAGDPIMAMVARPEGDIVVVPGNEAHRLAAEELPDDVEIHVVEWWKSPTDAARELAGARGLHEAQVVAALRSARAALLPGETERYARLCADAASVLTDALVDARPDESERALAARIGAGLLDHGAEPLVLLVAGDARVAHRHPLPTTAALGRRAMAVVCARRFGMIANVTRWVRFGAAPAGELDAERRLLEVEADVLDACRPGIAVADVLDVVKTAYPAHGFADDEWRNHHQGGPCGYVGRDPRAVDGVPDLLVDGHAAAWNPSAPGVKVEDTVLIAGDGIRILSLDERWPTVDVGGRARPVTWER